MSTNSSGIDLPYIPDDLLDALDKKFPERCPDPDDAERMIWAKSGQRSVIRYLKDQSRRQKEADALPASTTVIEFRKKVSEGIKTQW